MLVYYWDYRPNTGGTLEQPTLREAPHLYTVTSSPLLFKDAEGRWSRPSFGRTHNCFIILVDVAVILGNSLIQPQPDPQQKSMKSSGNMNYL